MEIDFDAATDVLRLDDARRIRRPHQQSPERLAGTAGAVPGAFRAGFHITLKFLGDIEFERADKMIEALRAAHEGASTFDVSAGEFGVFPHATRASVLWWGVNDGYDALSDAASRTDSALEPLGFQRERRPYVPHMTLARFREPVNLTTWLDDANAQLSAGELQPYAPFIARELTLIHSDLRREGPVYSPLATYPLSG